MEDELEYGIVNDIDGNAYKTVQIGDQIWMAENLRVTRFNDGTSIFYDNAMSDEDWYNLTTAAYCYYDNDPNYCEVTGALYNWFAVSGDSDADGESEHFASS